MIPTLGLKFPLRVPIVPLLGGSGGLSKWVNNGDS